MAVERSLATLSTGEDISIIGAHAYDYAGSSVSTAGDINGDGFDDFVVGAPLNDDGGYNGGCAYVIFGKADGMADIALSTFQAADGFRIIGSGGIDSTTMSERVGTLVSTAGDINGDGFADIVIGALEGGPGRSYVIFGKADGFADINLTDLTASDGFRITGGGAGDRADVVASAGDINGDGFDDLIIGAWGDDQGGTDAGAAYVVYGKESGFADINLAALGPTDGFKIIGDAAGDQAGWSVSSAGDVNNDGFDDFIIGAWLGEQSQGTPTDSGAAYVIFGKAGGLSTVDLTSLTSTDGFKVGGRAADEAGYSVSSAGDINGDGFDDIAIGAVNALNGSVRPGSVYVVFGKADGFTNITAFSLSTSGGGFNIMGETALATTGSSVSSAGDVNGDGFDDLILGSAKKSAAYVIYGRADGWTDISLGSLGDDGYKITEYGAVFLGGSVSAGDINGDGFSDIMIGAKRTDANGYDSGAAYVMYGSAPMEAVVRGGSEIDQTIRGGDFSDTLDGRGGDDMLIAAAGNDVLIGGDGNDLLDGGTGSDTLIGSAGDDIYVVDNANDIIVERAGEGSDTVNSSVSWKLGSGSENLTFTGSAAINGVGNNLANLMIGNAAPNLLNGSGGADTMEAGDGDDTYNVDNAGDQVIEASASGGTDKVNSSVAFTLGSYLENLTLTGGDAVNGKGNDLANTISGNRGNNSLFGFDGNDALNGGEGNDQLFGGLGTDKLTGGTGADRFVLDSTLGGDNHDNITDFTVVDDSLVLDRTIFTAFATNGTMASTAFFTGSASHDADDRIIYNSGNGNIYYDADGNGAGAQVLIAHVTGGLALTNADFLLVT